MNTLAATFARAIDVLRADGAVSVAVAFSGGLDSSVLLHLAHAHGLRPFVLHVHHGLSRNADAWLAHCEHAAQALGLPFDARRLALHAGGTGVEAAARKGRYAALGEMCRAHGATVLLTAHHLDDQAETVLLQLLRGAGPAGLSGMDVANTAPSLLGDETLRMARPLLSASRAELEGYARAHGIAHINDESNADPRYARNALRHDVMPQLAQAFAGYQERFARSAAHMQSAQRLLDELAEQDLARCLHRDAIACADLRAMSRDRANNMLRHLFHLRGLRMPSTAWLAEMLDQLLRAREDAQLSVKHPDCEVHRHRDRLHITPRLPALATDLSGQRFDWQGQPWIAFPAYAGVLHFDQAERGVDPAWLAAQPLLIDLRRGGERVKLAPNRPTRSLKQHYQSLDVPAWERTRLPVVYANGALLFAAGVGMDCAHIAPGAGVRLRWEPLR